MASAVEKLKDAFTIKKEPVLISIQEQVDNDHAKKLDEIKGRVKTHMYKNLDIDRKKACCASKRRCYVACC